jgi:hypothetical protein
MSWPNNAVIAVEMMANGLQGVFSDACSSVALKSLLGNDWKTSWYSSVSFRLAGLPASETWHNISAVGTPAFFIADAVMEPGSFVN